MKTNFMVISFDQTGEVNAMHRDQFDLGFLGNQKIERASDIRFDEDSQLWDIWLLEGPGARLPRITSAARGFNTYEQARDVEVAWLEGVALLGVEAISDRGIQLLRDIRLTLASAATF